jgi:uncharacterized LabA/DUF88 family protein
MKIAVLIDGGHLRVLLKKSGYFSDADSIEKIAHACVVKEEGEILFRALYYDCPSFTGKRKQPVSGKEKEFTANDSWLNDLASRNLFAVRKGVLKFRGFKPKKIPISTKALSDSDFRADFEQKGVDMRIGLDLATFATARTVDRVVLITGDTDCIPAMKHARKAGLQVVLIQFPNHKLAPELFWHTDVIRQVKYPNTLTPFNKSK